MRAKRAGSVTTSQKRESDNPCSAGNCPTPSVRSTRSQALLRLAHETKGDTGPALPRATHKLPLVPATTRSRGEMQNRCQPRPADLALAQLRRSVCCMIVILTDAHRPPV